MNRHANMEGFRIGLCQQPCKPADPAYNASCFIDAIKAAEADGLDLLVGVEGMQGYLIGDQYEYPAFCRAVDAANRRIVNATRGLKLAVAYGSLWTTWHQTGEDGRVMRHNGGYVVQNGMVVAGNKTLQPNYRMFPEQRYFFSNRHLAEKIALETRRPLSDVLHELLRTITLYRRNGQEYQLGQSFCEDMWDADYAIKPTLILAENGADIVVNHSASPWTWRKNDKRHRTVKAVLQAIPEQIRPAMFAYCNRTGVEQSAKNFYIYDGSSAVYDGDGDLIFEVGPYVAGTRAFSFSKTAPKVSPHVVDDTEAQHDAVAAVIDAFFGPMPDNKRFAYVGLSGGIDSSLVTALLVSRSCLGPNRVVGVNMPYGNYNSPEGQEDAAKLAANLGIQHRVVDITDMVDLIARNLGIEPGTLAHQNVQARCRMEVLAGLVQKHELLNGLLKTGGVYTANGNKLEMTFGFGTMYADIAGAIMLLVDFVKREEYQLADYLNRVVFGREIIPQRVFERTPSAELEKDQVDPFDYGSLTARGYHDEWVRAVTEFRWDPERFLLEYSRGTLEKSFLLPQGHIAKLFPTAESFVSRLEADWQAFTYAYVKRMQAPPGPVLTRRAFGGDLTESFYAYPFRTTEYLRLRQAVLASGPTL